MTSLPHLATRRDMLLGAGALFAWAYMPKLARAEGRDPRLLVVVLRGGLDGLGMVAPVGDPDWVKLRGEKGLALDRNPRALPLDSFFALNPAMPNLNRLYQARQATIVHAAATPYRERSHFDGQDVLESGYDRPAHVDSGWLNRALALLEADGRVDPRGGARGLAIGPVTPLVVRGPAPVMSWVPQRLLPASEDTQARLLDLYLHTDPKLARALQGRRDLLAVGRAAGISAVTAPEDENTAGFARLRRYFNDVAVTAAKYLARPDGPRVGAVGVSGWDTHINEGATGGVLSNLLGALDGTIPAFEQNMGDTWKETVVVFITEFGRTARINGTEGTDHGTGTVAWIIGGAVKGGRVIADWPGLKEADLYEDRDLRATTDLRAVLKGVLQDHLRVDERALAATVFPGSGDVKPMAGLV